MSSCPNCHKQIEIKEEHFGTLYRCSFCKSEFFVDFSGIPENSKEPLASESEVLSPEAPLSTTNQEVVPPSEEFQMASSHEQGNSGVLDSFFQQNIGTSLEPENPGFHTQPLPDSLGAPMDYSTPGNPLDSMSAYQEPVGESSSAPISSEASVPTENFSSEIMPAESPVGGAFFNEVAEFGNQVQNHSGILNFDIVIDEIDLPEQKQLLLEHLEDKRFGLDIEEVKTKLKYGKIEIQNFPAPKAIVLVQRLQGLSLKISWRENVATQ